MSTVNDRKKIILPEWTINLPNKTLMSSKDVAGFFGSKNLSYATHLAWSGGMPNPDGKLPRGHAKKFGKPMKYWLLGTLRNYEIEQQKVNK